MKALIYRLIDKGLTAGSVSSRERNFWLKMYGLPQSFKGWDMLAMMVLQSLDENLK